MDQEPQTQQAFEEKLNCKMTITKVDTSKFTAINYETRMDQEPQTQQAFEEKLNCKMTITKVDTSNFTAICYETLMDQRATNT